ALRQALVRMGTWGHLDPCRAVLRNRIRPAHAVARRGPADCRAHCALRVLHADLGDSAEHGGREHARFLRVPRGGGDRTGGDRLWADDRGHLERRLRRAQFHAWPLWDPVPQGLTAAGRRSEPRGGVPGCFRDGLALRADDDRTGGRVGRRALLPGLARRARRSGEGLRSQALTGTPACASVAIQQRAPPPRSGNATKFPASRLAVLCESIGHLISRHACTYTRYQVGYDFLMVAP